MFAHFLFEKRSLIDFQIGNELYVAHDDHFLFGNRSLTTFQMGNSLWDWLRRTAEVRLRPLEAKPFDFLGRLLPRQPEALPHRLLPRRLHQAGVPDP